MPLRGLCPVDKPHWNRYTPEETADGGGPTMQQVPILKELQPVVHSWSDMLDQVQTLKRLQPLESPQWRKYNP